MKTLVLKQNINPQPSTTAPCAVCCGPIDDGTPTDLNIGVFVEGTNDHVCLSCLRKQLPEAEPLLRRHDTRVAPRRLGSATPVKRADGGRY